MVLVVLVCGKERSVGRSRGRNCVVITTPDGGSGRCDGSSFLTGLNMGRCCGGGLLELRAAIPPA